MITGVKCRAAVAADLPACIGVRGRTRDNPLSAEHLASLGVTPEGWSPLMERQQIQGFVAESASEIVGFCFGDQRSERCWCLRCFRMSRVRCRPRAAEPAYRNPVLLWASRAMAGGISPSGCAGTRVLSATGLDVEGGQHRIGVTWATEWDLVACQTRACGPAMGRPHDSGVAAGGPSNVDSGHALLDTSLSPSFK